MQTGSGGGKRVFMAIVGVCAALAAGCTKQVSDKDIRSASLVQVRELTTGPKAERVALVDPRSRQDFEAGRIPGARNMGLADAYARGGESLNPRLAGFEWIIVYGDDPASAVARAMTKRLMEAGAKRVWLFPGGLHEWSAAGLPVERGAGGE